MKIRLNGTMNIGRVKYTVGTGGRVATSVTSGSECPPDIHSTPSVSLRYPTVRSYNP